jgi:Uncharacterized conserved protein
MTTTLDLRKDLKHLYAPSAEKPALVEVPPMRFFAIDGGGQPGGERFQAAMQALFTMAYSTRSPDATTRSTSVIPIGQRPRS